MIRIIKEIIAQHREYVSRLKSLSMNDRYILKYLHARTGRSKAEILRSGDVEAMRDNFVFEEGGEPNGQREVQSSNGE